MFFFDKIKKIGQKINWELVGIVILPFVLSCICQRLSIGRNYDINWNVLTLNYILWLTILLFFISIFKENCLSLIFYVLFFFLFTILDRYRIKFLNEPLRFNDINLIPQLPGVFSFLSRYENLKKELTLSILGLIIIFWLIKKLFKGKIKNVRLRIIFFTISLLILTLPYLNSGLYNKILGVNKIVFNPWYRLENCQNNGTMLCFIDDIQFIKHKEPKDYNQAKIEKIFEQIKQESTVKKSGIKPNVILILSESLWEATKMPKVKFSPDPLSNIRQDIKGNFISPSFGGGTANVEFELLTGLSNYLFQNDSFPYTDLIRKNTPSLFTVFKNNGYLTSAIHPYSPQFYNRKNIYKYFGLDKFISLDQMPNFKNAGPFVSDEFFADEILKQFNSTKEPQLIFGISMQNHDLFEPNRFPNQQIKIDGPLNKEDRDILQTYIEGVNLTDKSYKYLKDELKKINRPTIVIMFGDHLPFLNDNYGIYKSSGYIDNDENNWSQKDRLNMYSTPLTIWNNYGAKIPQLNNIGPAQLSAEILNLTNTEPEYQFKFINQLKEKISYLTKKIGSDISPYQNLLKDYELIQYDILFGKQYLSK